MLGAKLGLLLYGDVSVMMHLNTIETAEHYIFFLFIYRVQKFDSLNEA